MAEPDASVVAVPSQPVSLLDAAQLGPDAGAGAGAGVVTDDGIRTERIQDAIQAVQGEMALLPDSPHPDRTSWEAAETPNQSDIVTGPSSEAAIRAQSLDEPLKHVVAQLVAAEGSLVGMGNVAHYGLAFANALQSLKAGVQVQKRAAQLLHDQASKLGDPDYQASVGADSEVGLSNNAFLPGSLSALSAGGSSKRRSKRPRESTGGAKREANPDETRKQRMIRLEHLVHKYANRRLGVEYTVRPFDVAGTADLPDPRSPALDAEQSAQKIQEYRPDFTQHDSHPSVAAYFAVACEDVGRAWRSGEGREEDEPEEDLDVAKILEAIRVYWIRLGRRWSRQQAVNQGQVHKDDLIHRKQNQFRRQQSLLARRIAAFDRSPLNYCKLRALYRTLLTTDFAAPTNERPDSSRQYTEDEWYTYQAARDRDKDTPSAHEVVDIFWLSAAARGLLDLLDLSVAEQASQLKGKGKPRQPAPTFHLPPELWAKGAAYLPKLRPRGADGLPLETDPAGIVLFKWHVDEDVQRAYPEWAAGLYDEPPVPTADEPLPDLQRVMRTREFANLLVDMRLATSAAAADTTDDGVDRSNDADLGTLPSVRELVPADHPAVHPAALAGGGGPSVPPEIDPALADPTDTPRGPRPGTSLRARKQSKRSARQAPEGAAVPVAKRPKPQDDGVSLNPSPTADDAEPINGALEQDKAFITGL